MASEWLQGLQRAASGAEPRPVPELRVVEPRRRLPPFTGQDPARDYRAMYRAACEYHERNNPPRLGDAYWSSAFEDMMATAARFDNDPFLAGLLLAVYEELEREYKQIRDV